MSLIIWLELSKTENLQAKLLTIGDWRPNEDSEAGGDLVLRETLLLKARREHVS